MTTGIRLFFCDSSPESRHHNGRTRVALRPQLRKEHVVEAVAVDVFDKQHRAAVAGLLELALSQRRHSGVGFGFRQHFIPDGATTTAPPTSR